MNHYLFRHPFTCMVCGPTRSGKTLLVRRILKNFRILMDLKTTKLRVLWCYGQWQNIYETEIASNVDVVYISGFPTDDDIKEKDIIILDDLMNELANDNRLSNLFTRGSHHLNLSIFFLTQNLFNQGKFMRNIGLNCHYIILMKSPRGKAQLTYLGREIFPGKSQYIMESYSDATINPFSYLRIDLTQETPDIYRVSTRLTPEETNKNKLSPVFYIPK